jgi:hypothetical protein
MSEKEEAGERGFVVVDRRASAGASDEAPAADAAAGGSPPEAAPSVDFAVLVQSFFVTALYHLGFAPDPESGRPGERNLALARQNIEILALIHEKTRGNLDAEEQQLLEGLLYEVRMRFVEASQAPGT